MKNLEKLISLRSDKNCDEILEFLTTEFEGKVEEVKVVGDEWKGLLVGINTKLRDTEPVILSGHIDTVNANEKLYATNPYELTEINGKCFGLGSIDMKSFVATMIDNIEMIKKFDCPIVLALSTDEETTLNSINVLIDAMKKLNINPKFTIIGEPTNQKFGLSSNACYEYDVRFFGKACHSSRISEGINSICACAKFVTFIEENQKKYDITANCGVVCGGDVVNKVPDYAELKFDIRSIFKADIDKFLVDVNNFIIELEKQYDGLKIDIKNNLLIPAFNMFGNDKIKSIANELNIESESFSGGCEAGYYTAYSGDAVIFGVGDLALAHKPNEFVVKEEYYVFAKKLLKLLQCLQKYYYV